MSYPGKHQACLAFVIVLDVCLTSPPLTDENGRLMEVKITELVYGGGGIWAP